MNHQMSKSTTKKNRNRLFCCYYANYGNVEEAARKAGFPIETAAVDGADLLRKSVYQKMVADYRQALQNETMAQVKTGLERLSFGRCNDVLQLLLAEETLTSCEIQSLDLYSVASIKRDKNGGVEIHFADRQKALCSLYEFSGDAAGNAAAQSLLEAIVSTPTEGGDLE